MKSNIIQYDFGKGAEAFSYGKDTSVPSGIILGDQIHDIRTAVIRSKNPDESSLKGTDALITNLRGIIIGVRTADCVPILLYDPIRETVAAIHAGWKGTLRRIVGSCIATMISEYGCHPEDVIAHMGPGISSESFQVGEDVAITFKDVNFPLDVVYSWGGGKEDGNIRTGHHIDLFAANKWILEQNGVLTKNIFTCGIDTFTDGSFYSARRDGADCGRNITTICLL